jgi:serine/threonine protein kinase
MGRTPRFNPLIDYYERLQVHPRASGEVVDAAYRALAKHAHRDGGGSDTIFRPLAEAHDVISDANLRREYDEARQSSKGIIVGNYRIIEPIAEGGFGKTYKAEHVLTGKLACVKDCSNVPLDQAEILINEACAVWDLRHFGLPNMKDVIKLDDGRILLVMSFIPGRTLWKIIEDHGRLDPEHVGWMMERLLNILKYMHFHGVIHGDVKPQNVIIPPDGHTAVLVDFGLSMVKPTSSSRNLGRTKVFAPPEAEAKAGMPLVPESDLYSLGMTMVHALSGDIKRTVRKEIPSDVPGPLENFINRFLVRDVLSRPCWDKEDLCETIVKVRIDSFGQRHSAMKPLPV